MDEGLIEEVSCLLKSGVSFEKLLSLGLEYKFVCEFLMGKYNKQKMIELLGIAIQQFAKRQMTYFRKMEKSGLKINWVCNHDEALILLKNKKFIV
jgi:tRNA dimethylallyltransferase